MNIEEWVAQVNGTIEALTLTCSSLVATHPEKDKVSLLLLALANHAGEEANDPPTAKSYKLGIRNAVGSILQGISTAKEAELMRSPGNKPGGH